MSRASASMRNSGSSAAAAAAAARDSAAAPSAFGGGALLRTKHIDTLQVLETYSRDVDRLTRENQSLTEKLSKLTSLSGDPFAQISSLQTILQVERDSNHELQSRIKIFGMEADRHRSELSNRDTSLRDLSQQLSALRSEHDALRSTHSSCIASRQSLHESIDQLSRRNSELESHSGDVQSLRAQLDKQSSRLQQLEIQAALGPPLPVAAPCADYAAAKQLKAKLTKSKEKFTAAQVELSACKAMLEQEQTRGEDQQAANKTLTESVRKLQAELAALSQQQQQQPSQPAPVSARPSKPQLQQSKDELARREKEWNAERKDLLAQLDAARKTAASSSAAAVAATAAAAAAAAAPARPSASERESRELILHLQSEVSSLRSQLEHLHAQNTHLRAEHTKVSQALNKLLASGGGGAMGGLAVGGGKQASSASITIASKQGGFAEVMSIKRENEALRAQITEAQQIIQMLQHKIGTQQSAAAPNAAVGAAPAASTNPARRSGRSSGSGQFSVSAGSKSLQLIAAHEAEHGPVSAVQSSGSRQSSPPAAVSSLRGSPPRSATMQAGVSVANQQRR